MSGLQQLRQLASLIQESVTALERISHETNTTLPDLDDAHPVQASEVLNATPAARRASRIIVAAGLQLAALARTPREAVFDVVHGVYKAAALRVCLESNATEILREAGVEGMHAHEIAAKSNIDGAKLARLMRYLASNHIYREVSPDVFANNRLSAALDTGKPSDLCASPETKYLNTTSAAFPAVASFILGSRATAAAQLWETLSDPTTAFSYDVIHSASHCALGIDVPVWVWNEQPGREFARKLFAQAMRGYSDFQPPSAILEAYPWAELPEGSIVVDVGGGVGSAMLPLAKEHPHLQIVVQDHKNVVQDALSMWNAELPEAVQSKRVVFQAQDFFAPQPSRPTDTPVSIFFMRYVLHDWSDEDARKILQQLRAAAHPDTVLIILDHALPYLFRGNSNSNSSDPPEPLLPTYGAANTMGYVKDVVMMVNLNGKERREDELEALVESAGWKFEGVKEVEGTHGFFLPARAVPK
ncbi:S-adenosyl-L-methionine-dependent methyltransferase [Roridomyces roridus]|uniref:S-adenosyl-L-methionine-dependent methyltransferase n=1 Tax=Roridomyces roridus TaxID=1738132 RepID=A0AAD7FED2_9AGAR|nr:S-adenosyl-L-methionine-dependent methyltransferase [Roridomyces roridus]